MCSLVKGKFLLILPGNVYLFTVTSPSLLRSRSHRPSWSQPLTPVHLSKDPSSSRSPRLQGCSSKSPTGAVGTERTTSGRLGVGLRRGVRGQPGRLGALGGRDTVDEPTTYVDESRWTTPCLTCRGLMEEEVTPDSRPPSCGPTILWGEEATPTPTPTPTVGLDVGPNLRPS